METKFPGSDIRNTRYMEIMREKKIANALNDMNQELLASADSFSGLTGNRTQIKSLGNSYSIR